MSNVGNTFSGNSNSTRYIQFEFEFAYSIQRNRMTKLFYQNFTVFFFVIAKPMSFIRSNLIITVDMYRH